MLKEKSKRPASASYISNRLYYPMPIELSNYIQRIKKLIEGYFTGSVTIHFAEGVIQKIETREVERNL